MSTEQNRMLDVLFKLAPTLNWLNDVEPVHDSKIPEEHAEGMKQLENLGLSYRRNNHICALQKQRLFKIIRNEFQLAEHDQQIKCISAFGTILELQMVQGSGTEGLGPSLFVTNGK